METDVKEPIVEYQPKGLSIEEYLVLERQATVKHEYFRGEAFAMWGAGHRHKIIFSNLFGNLANKLKGKKGRPHGSNRRVLISENTSFTYPEISISWSELKTFSPKEDSTELIEILSSSTKNYNRGEKFRLYRELLSQQECFLIDTEAILVEVFRFNQSKYGELEEYNVWSGTLTIPAVEVSVSLPDIDAGTKLIQS